MFCGIDNILWNVLRNTIKLSIPHDVVMELNNVVLKCPAVTLEHGWVVSLLGHCRRPKFKVMTSFSYP